MSYRQQISELYVSIHRVTARNNKSIHSNEALQKTDIM